jgi:hypothetical protein
MKVLKGDLVTLDLVKFVDYYAMIYDPDWIVDVLEGKFIIGLVVSSAFREDEIITYDSEWKSERIYLKKMYNVYICGRIIPIYANDIGEKL